MTKPTPDYPDAIIIVPIDALLDTRLGTAAKLDIKSVGVLGNSKYLERTDNNLWELCDNFTEEEYRKAWEGRDKETLKFSILSNFKTILVDMIATRTKGIIEDGGQGRIKVKINTWPYIFEGSEIEGLKDIITTLISDAVIVDVCHLSTKRLSPKYLKTNNIDAFVCMDFIEWLEAHSEHLDRCPLPAIECITPQAMEGVAERFAQGVKEKKIDGSVAEHFDVYEMIELSLTGGLQLSFVPAIGFSAVSV